MKIASVLVFTIILSLALIGSSRGKAIDTSPKEPAKQAEPAPWLADSPQVASPLIGTVHFGEKPAAVRPPSPIDGIGEFAIDDHGRFGFLKAESFVLLDHDGRVLKTIAMPKLRWEFLHTQLAWLGGDRWIVIGSTRDKANAFWLDAKDGTVTPVAGFEMPGIVRVASSRDGGFVVMTVTEKQEPMSQDFPAVLIKFTTFYQTLVAFDGQGRKRWTVDGFTDAGIFGFNADDFAVTSSHHVVVMGGSVAEFEGKFQKFLVVYGMDGKQQKIVDLSKSWGSHVSARIQPDASGGVILFDDWVDASVARLDLDGHVLASFEPKYEDEYRFKPKGSFQFDPDGSLWTDDGHALLRLDATGKVDRALGTRVDPYQLSDDRAVEVDSHGRIDVLDRSSGVVHVFDALGRPLFTDRPAPSDHWGMGGSLEVAPTGDVYVSSFYKGDVRYADRVHFTPDGKRVGVESFRSGASTNQRWLFQPQQGTRWVIADRGKIHRVDAKGRILSTVGPALDMLDDIVDQTVTSNGSLAVMAERIRKTGVWPLDQSEKYFSVFLFSPDGKPLASWNLPEQDHPCCIAFDGDRIALLMHAGPLVEKRDADGKTHRMYEKTAVVVMDTHGKPLFHFPVVAAGLFMVEGKAGRELWFRTGMNTFNRYAMH